MGDLLSNQSLVGGILLVGGWMLLLCLGLAARELEAGIRRHALAVEVARLRIRQWERMQAIKAAADLEVQMAQQRVAKAA